MHFRTSKHLSSYSLNCLSWLLLFNFCTIIVARSLLPINETLVERAIGFSPIPYPSRQQCFNAVQNGQPVPDHALFVAGMPRDYFDFIEWYAKVYGLSWIISPNVWKSDFIKRGRYRGTENEEKAFQSNYAWAFAARAKGRVFLMMPFDTAPSEDGIFWKSQWPALEKGGKVNQVIWLDGNRVLDGTLGPPYHVEERWWRRRDGNPPASTPQARAIDPPSITVPAEDSRSTVSALSTAAPEDPSWFFDIQGHFKRRVSPTVSP